VDPLSEVRTYKVTGYAMVPWQCEIDVDASSELEAKEKAREVFKREREQCLVPNGFGCDGANSFEPSQAEIRQ